MIGFVKDYDILSNWVIIKAEKSHDLSLSLDSQLHRKYTN
jgi:hypothetical protein